MAVSARVELGQAADDRLDVKRYIAGIGVVMLDIDKLTMSESSRRQLLEVDKDSWSGMTLRDGSNTAVLINPAHPPGRRLNTLMHEAAHVVMRHGPIRVDIGPGGILLVSAFSEDDEAEADWLAGAMLLPREALMACRERGMNNAQIAQCYGVSSELCEWRIRMTGIDVQRRRAGRA